MSVSNSSLRSRESILARLHSTVVRTAKSASVFALQAPVDVKTEFIVEDADTESLAAMTTKVADPVEWGIDLGTWLYLLLLWGTKKKEADPTHPLALLYPAAAPASVPSACRLASGDVVLPAIGLSFGPSLVYLY
jgi:hypothetical protein